jgi:D-alanyl-D-alanine carboxypeptidase (penicillin-binding protein 5/6)
MSRELLTKHPEIKKYTTIWMDTVRGGTFGLSNTNKLVLFYPGCTGLKTGFTAAACYCLSASAQRDGVELIAVVMGSATSKDRFAACKALLDYGFANFATVNPEMETIPEIPVTLGQKETVRAVPAEKTALLVDKSQVNKVNIQTETEESVKAPVSKGQRLGTMTIRVGEQVISQIPLVAEESVPKKTWGQLVIEMLKKFCGAK